jgi:hypothetical protein
MPYTTIDKGSSYFNTVLYTGNGSVRSITGVGFQPDWVWLKNRNSTEWHSLFDAVRGSLLNIRTNSTNAEVSATGTLTSFNSDGFSLGTDPSSYGVNTNTNTYVSWNWKANGSGSSNTAGSITSTVSANTTSGFSIVTYTGTGANATVGHGLGVAPKFIIIKNRSVGGTDWRVGHQSLTWNNEIFLNLTNATNASSGAWNNTAPTSSVFSLGSGSYGNGSGNSIIAYCFADVKGYSKFGSYTGNGSTDGTFVYTGFKPRWIMVKSRGDTGGWTIMDTSRIGYNASNYTLYAEATTAEQGYLPIDILSNGFKLRIVSTGTSFNSNTINYIYMAFAENPFVSSKGIPTTAR